jgi:DDE_Tnp_1-associated
MEAFSPKPQLRVLLDQLATIKDTRESCKVAYPLREVLFLVVCGTIASGDDYDDIVDWGEAHLSFLRGFSEFYHGIPCADWGKDHGRIEVEPTRSAMLSTGSALSARRG